MCKATPELRYKRVALKAISPTQLTRASSGGDVALCYGGGADLRPSHPALGASEELDQVVNQDRWRLLEKLTVDIG